MCRVGEGDVRRPELDESIAGVFRTDTDIARFVTIRSELSIMRVGILEVLSLIFPGSPPVSRGLRHGTTTAVARTT